MTILHSIETTLKTEIVNAILQAELCAESDIPSFVLEQPKERTHGDFATNIAMQLARVAKKAPRQIAEEIVSHINYDIAQIKKIDIAGPGFINFYMVETYLNDIIYTVLKGGDEFGKTDVGSNKRIQVEFVSVNPTGEPHLGHARGAVFGDVLCNLFAAAGYDVEREYYINDAGNQMEQLALSI